MRRVVDLPQPDPPMMTMVSPRWTSKVTPSSTTLPSKLLTTSLRLMMGASVSGASLDMGDILPGPGGYGQAKAWRAGVSI